MYIDIVIDNISSLSIQKYSSKVVEKIISVFKGDKRRHFILALFQDSKISYLLKSKFSTKIIYKAIEVMTIEEKEEVQTQLETRLQSLSKQEKSKIVSIINLLKSNTTLY